MKSSGIGGQAVMEGVMMKNKSEYAVAVRKSDNKIVIKKDKVKSEEDRPKFFRLPVIRGVVNFVDSLMLGVSTLTYSASFFEEEENVEPTKLEKAFAKVFKDKAEAVTMGFCVVLSLVIAIGMFMILPMLISNFLGGKITSTNLQILVEGVIRITLFVLYVMFISLMKDIKRTFMYHGAEHKTINCIEHGLDLTVENVRKQSKQHKRCGTSFLLIVMFISVIFFMFIRCETVWLKIVIRLLLVPVIAGVSYEFLKLCGRSESKIINILSKPGMWLQRLTTREPDDSMIEVAIASVEAVFDWKPYVEEVRAEKENRKKQRAQEKKAKRRSSKEDLDKENKNFYNNYRQDGYAEYDTDEDEVDEILNALDKMFIEKEEQEGEFEAKPSVDSEPMFRRNANRYLNQGLKSDDAKEPSSETVEENAVEETVAESNSDESNETIAQENNTQVETADNESVENKDLDDETETEDDVEETTEVKEQPQVNKQDNSNQNRNNNNRNNHKNGKKKRRKKKR